MANKKKSDRAENPSEFSIHWDYFLVTGFVPPLERGRYVLVEYAGRNRVAVVESKMAGGCYWASLCAPVGGQKRVVVSKHSLRGLASNA